MSLKMGSQLFQALSEGCGCGGGPHCMICHTWFPLSLQDGFTVASKIQQAIFLTLVEFSVLSTAVMGVAGQRGHFWTHLP